MFGKIVAVDETLLTGAYECELHKWGKEVVVYHDFPSEADDVISRIGDADCLLVSFRTPIGKEVMDACRNLKYIGMYCSVYDPRSCNVDLAEAERKGITVKGVRDYGDEGVVEYVISELVRLLHGFGGRRWKEQPTELTGQKAASSDLARRAAWWRMRSGCSGHRFPITAVTGSRMEMQKDMSINHCTAC